MNPKTIRASKASPAPQWRSCFQLSLVLAMLAWSVEGQAQQTDTWSGLGGDANWFTAANWNTAVTTNGDNLIFTGTTRTAPNNNFTNLHISSITFNSPQFTVGGSALTITNGITDSGTAGSNTVSIPLTIGATQTFANNGPGTNTVSGAIALLGNTLKFAGSGTIFVSGTISTTNTGVIEVDSGVTRLSATAAWGSNVVDAVIIGGGGTLQLGNAGAIPGGANFGNTLVNGTLDLNGTGPTVSGLEGGGIVDSVFSTGVSSITVGAGNTNDTFNGVIKNTAGLVSLIKTGYGTETINGANTYGGSTLVQQGTLAVGLSGQIGNASKAMVISPGAVLDVSALGPFNSYEPFTVFNLNAGTPTKPYTNFLGSYNTNYVNFVITTNVVATTNVYTTNSIVSVVYADLNGNFDLSGGSFTPVAPAPGYATFTVNGNLSLDNFSGLGANTLFFLLNSVTNAGGGLNDLIVVTNGALSIGDNVNIVIQPANGTLATGKYTLIESTNYTSGGGNSVSPATYSVIAPRGISGTIDTTTQPGNVLLTASGTAVPASIVWAGIATSNNWDIDVSPNWKKGGVQDYFFSQDSVTFDDTAYGIINLPGPVTPNATTFNNSLTNYVFNANIGAFIAGTGGLTLNGTATVTLNNPNSFTGNITLNNGSTLILGSYGGFGNSIIYSGVTPGQLIFGSGQNTLFNNESIANTSQATALGGLTLQPGANAQLGTLGTRGSNDTGYMAVGANINRSVGSSLYINFTLKGGTANNGVYFTNTIPWTNGLILNAGWIHTGTDWLAAQTNLFNGNNPATGLYNYTGYSNNTALATWVATNNMSLTASTFADTASTTINSLKLQGPSTLTISSGQTLTLQNGGLLVSSAGTGPSTILGGTLEGAAGADLIVLQNLTGFALTIGSVIADNGSPTALTLGGLGGTLILTNNNTYTGATYINAGSLQVGAGTALGSIASSSAIFDNGSLSFNRPDNTSVGGVVSGLGGITQLGLGTLSLTANNTFLGKLAINSGTVQLGAGGTSGSISNAASVVDNGTLVLNNSGILGYSKVISGYGQLVQFGAGMFVVSTNEAYTGPTTISNGIVLLTASGSISNTASIAINAGATLDVSAVVGGLTLRGTAPAETLAGKGTINGSLTTASGTTLFPGGSGVVGNLTVNNNLTLNGGSYVFDLSNSSHDQIAVGGTLTQAGGAVIVQITGTLANGLYPLITATGGLSGAAGNISLANFSQAGQIAVLTNSTANELDLLVVSGTAPNDFWLGDGSQNLWDTTASSFWLNSVGNPTTYANGDVVFFNDTGSTTPAVNIDAVIHPGTITVNSTNDNYTLGVSTANGRITGGASLVKNGPGTLVLQTVNDYLSGTTINGGVIQLNGTGAAAADGMVGVGPVVNNGTLIASNANTETLAGNLSGSGQLVQQGLGTLILAGNNSAYSGPITFSNLLQVGNGGASGTLGTGNVTDNGTLLFNLAIPNSTTVNANISGSGGITNVGTGTTTLNGNDSYAGLTVIPAGTLRAGSATAIPPTTTLVLNDGTVPAGTFDLNGQNVQVASLAGSNAGNGTPTLSVGTIINNGGGVATLTISSGLTNTFNGQILDSTTGGGKTALAVLNGANETLFVLTNSSGPVFPFPSTFSGGITISNATLSVGAVLAATPGNEGSAALGGNPIGTQNILMTGTNAVLFTAGSAGSQTPTINTAVGNLTIPSGSTATIVSPFRGTFSQTLLGSGTLNFKVNVVQRAAVGGDWSGFTGTINFSALNGGEPIPFNSTSTAGLPNANVVMQITNNSGVVYLCTQNAGSVFPIGALSGGDNTSGLCGATGSNGDGGQPSIFAIGGLNTSTTFGGTIIDTSVGIRKVGTGTLTLTNAVLSYTGQTVVSNGVLALIPTVATPATTAAAATYLVGSNFTLVSPGIMNVAGMGGSLLLGHSTFQTLFGNGTLAGNLTATSAYIAPGLRASQAGFFTGSGLNVSGSVTMTAGTTNFITINRTNAVQNDSITASSIACGGVLIVTNLGDTAYPGTSTNVFHLFNGTISGIFASITLPALPANEFWITNLSAGTISLVNTAAGLASNPTNITFSVSGNVLSLTWPADHLGWTLQAQTNALTSGLKTNWVDVAGSAASTSATITIDPAKPTVFYRLSQQP